MGLRDMAAPAGVAAGASQAPSPESVPGMELPTVESPPPTHPDEANHAGGEVDAAAAEQVFDFCLKQIYGGKSTEGDLNPQVAGMLREGENPVDALAETAATVVTAAAMKHEGVTGDVLSIVSLGVIGELADASREVGLYEYSEEELEDATINAQAELVENTRNMPGIWNPEEATDDFNQLMAMNESGELDEMLSGISEGGPEDEMEAPGGAG